MKSIGFINGKVYLSNAKFAQAFLIKEHKFLTVGSNDQILNEQPDQIIDLKGKTVIPGFIDSHVHFFYSAKYAHYLNIGSAKNFDDIARLIDQFQQKHKIQSDSVIIGYGLNELNLQEGKIPKRKELDQMLENVPLFLWRGDYHSGVCNTQALKRFDLFKQNAVSPGSIIELDEQGWPTGFVREMITWRIEKLISKSDIEKEAAYLKKYVQYANEIGLTGIYTCDLRNANWQSSLEQIQMLENDLTLEVYHQLWLTETEWLKDFLSKKDQIILPDNHKLAAIKFFADGTNYSNTSSLSQELATKFNKQSLKPYTEERDFEQYVRELNQLGFAVTTHAIGDRAIASVIENYQKVDKTNQARNAIIHACYLNKDLIKQLAHSNIPVGFEMCSLKNNFVRELDESFLPFKTCLDNQVNVGMSTDHLVFPLEPLNNVYWAVNHPNKQERVSIYQAIDAYTKGSAYFMNAEKIMGQIKTDYLANFVIYEQDIFDVNRIEQLKTIKPFQTWFRGKVVWSNQK
ncbi:MULTISPECIES: amidohydrolase [unclassified Mycoplasma]|uniref:amidohydrolase n=1 Tax=unclassified Mycoplasma TaxID=2683645 RepID=UPI00211D1433|nr:MULTISPECIES: amidohydrolase [unclassified Mycoplasma]UUM19744.1 amidohydrolase [Mycoplasma sp. 1578d]UUM24728.1 amidohydrolase [Mycoplasma sp. 3686d]